MYKDLELMEIQTEVLFNIDNLERITKINEPICLTAPLLFLGRTKEGNIIRFNKTYPDSEKAVIYQIINNNQMNVDIGKLIINASKIKAIKSIWMGPAYVFTNDFNMNSNAIKITDENKELLQKGFPNLFKQFEYRQPVFATIQDGIAVSVCCSARKSTKGAEASVETLKFYQGRGFATNNVIAWANKVKSQGLLPLYSTEWDNFSSQAVAKKLNLYQYGVDFHIS